tara:strand:+ start:3040 stop:3585 length:546 start_codon:yes stop_codon:yes gene_type:complete
MTLVLTALYSAVTVRQIDVTALCVLSVIFSVHWHSGDTAWQKPDGWLSRFGILYIAARVVLEHGAAAIVIASLIVIDIWIWNDDVVFFSSLGATGFLICINYKKLFWPDVVATAVFAISGYMCYHTEKIGMHGLWHSFMATATAFAVTVPIESKWHLLMPWPKNIHTNVVDTRKKESFIRF